MLNNSYRITSPKPNFHSILGAHVITDLACDVNERKGLVSESVQTIEMGWSILLG